MIFLQSLSCTCISIEKFKQKTITHYLIDIGFKSIASILLTLKKYRQY